MSIHEYVVCERDGLWEVRLDDRLLSGQPTYEQALAMLKLWPAPRAPVASERKFCWELTRRSTDRLIPGSRHVDEHRKGCARGGAELCGVVSNRAPPFAPRGQSYGPCVHYRCPFSYIVNRRLFGAGPA